MFAYCLNNPTNRLDLEGSASVWWHIITKTKNWGVVHRKVSNHIINHYPDLDAEMTLLGIGRADIVNLETGEVWEIKHAGNIKGIRILTAQKQARGYINGNEVKKLGAANSFSGSFTFSYCGDSYIIYYETPAEGAVVYWIEEVDDGNYEFDLDPNTVNTTVAGSAALLATYLYGKSLLGNSGMAYASRPIGFLGIPILGNGPGLNTLGAQLAYDFY